MTWIAVACGSALGGVARYWLTLVAARAWGATFPWGTLLINVIGSFVIGGFGALTAASGRMPGSDEVRAFVLIGICGGFTTFSSFSLQTLELIRAEAYGAASFYVGASVALCLLGVFLGAWLATGLAWPSRPSL